MALAKRIFLFLVVNFLVVVTISIITNALGLNYYLNDYGLDTGKLAMFCAVWGMGGSFISLLMSRAIAKMSMGLKVIPTTTTDPGLRDLLEMVHDLSRRAGLTTMPEVAIYDSPELNAFATGPSRSQALVAVSSGLLQRMDRNELAGVLGHEISHVANGDMVTMTLLQGIVNAFVMFFARILAFALVRGRSDENGRSIGGGYMAYYLVEMLLQFVFMLLGSLVVAWFSRHREFRADAGGAKLAGASGMIGALQALKRNATGIRAEMETPQTVRALMIFGKPTNIGNLFASHPPLDERIARLQSGS